VKTLNFNKNSWHYRLATKVGDFDEEDGDFCSYVRNVTLGVFLSAMMVTMISIILYAIGREFYAAYTCWFTPVCTFGNFEKAVALTVAIAAGVVFTIFMLVWNSNRRRRIREEIYLGRRMAPQPGFVKTAYKSIKEKTCFKVEFK
jgi:hypothetical protein